MESSKSSKMKLIISTILVVVMLAMTLTGCVDEKDMFSVTVNGDSSKGYVYGAGEYYEGQYVVIGAEAKDGYVFDEWSDGNDDAIRTVFVSEDCSYTAIFKVASTTPNEPVQTYYELDKIELYVVETSSAEDINLFCTGIEVENYDPATAYLYSSIVGSVDLNAIYLTDWSGLQLVDMRYYNNQIHTNIVADSDKPYSFYSPRNEYNQFLAGETAELRINVSWCSQGYLLDYDGNTYQKIATATSYNNAIVSLDVTPSATSKSYTKSVATVNGYNIMIKLNFVEA